MNRGCGGTGQLQHFISKEETHLEVRRVPAVRYHQQEC